jgi:glycerophosphoryl diester phosphodiesterase
MTFFRTDRPLILAHRGASRIAPENTLVAFCLALEQGADGLELDVQLSRDGVPVVFHDSELSRTTDGRGRISEKTLAELRTLDAGKWFDPRFAGERIPTLEEVFEAFGDRALYNIELKAFGVQDDGLVQAVVAWTVNDLQEAERLIRLRVDALITDDPALLVRFLGVQ